MTEQTVRLLFSSCVHSSPKRPTVQKNPMHISISCTPESVTTVLVVFLQGSKFYENELKRDKQVNQRIEKMMLQKAQITEQQLKKAQAQVRHVMG